MIYLFLILGSAVLFAMRLNEAWFKPSFTWMYFVKKNIIPAFIVIAFGLAMILAKDDAERYIARLFPEFGFKITSFTMFLFGITGDVILKKVLGLFDPENKTVVGKNN